MHILTLHVIEILTTLHKKITSRSGLEIFMHINRILTKLCLKAGGPVIMDTPCIMASATENDRSIELLKRIAAHGFTCTLAIA